MLPNHAQHLRPLVLLRLLNRGGKVEASKLVKVAELDECDERRATAPRGIARGDGNRHVFFAGHRRWYGRRCERGGGRRVRDGSGRDARAAAGQRSEGERY
jgi:hypothetical protein